VLELRLSQFRGEGASLASLFRRYCTLPDPLTSLEEAERRAHVDLPQRIRSELRQEREVLRLWLRFQIAAHPWFHERLHRIGQELAHGS